MIRSETDWIEWLEVDSSKTTEITIGMRKSKLAKSWQPKLKLTWKKATTIAFHYKWSVGCHCLLAYLMRSWLRSLILCHYALLNHFLYLALAGINIFIKITGLCFCRTSLHIFFTLRELLLWSSKYIVVSIRHLHIDSFVEKWMMLCGVYFLL